jgi:hypothetical protein
MKQRVLGLVAALALGAAAVSYEPSAQVAFRHEPGVETNVTFGAGVAAQPGAGVTVDANVGFALVQHMGIAHFRLGASAHPLLGNRVGFEAAVEHDQWVEWSTGENRAVGMVHARPFSALTLGLGAAWRAPVMGDSVHPDAYSSPFNWQSDNPELNLLYDLRWRFLRGPRLGLEAYASNHDEWATHNPQQFPFGISGTWSAGGYAICGRLGSDIKGLSGLLLSIGELRLDIGVRRAL